MAFKDDPIIDNSSKNSEESVLAVKSLFTQKNGFICREETPDFGVDEDVELIINNGASGKKFAIQIKSVVKAKVVTKEENEYVTIQFKSSRIGYLCRRPPAYGIIIVYDEFSESIYYDYVESICFRLNDFHGSDEWKASSRPNIHIPIENQLTKFAVKEIHDKFVRRYKNNQSLLSNHGEKYGIPIFYDSILENEFGTKENIVEFLESDGCKLIDYNNIPYLKRLIDQLSLSEILNSYQITVLSAQVNCEMGNYIEADFFLKKCNYKKGASSELKNIIDFVQLKTDFALGNSNNGELLSNLEAMQKEVNGELDKISIAINIVYFKILISYDEKRYDTNHLEEIEAVFENIRSSNIDNNEKYDAINFHALNLNAFSINLFIEKVGSFLIRESLNFKTSIESKKNDVLLISHFLELPRKYTLSALRYANETENKHMRASSHSQLSRYFLSLYSNYLNFEIIPQISDDLIDYYKSHLNCALKAFNEFLELEYPRKAYDSLVVGYELILLFEAMYGQKLNSIDRSEIENKINNLQKQLYLPNYESLVLKILDTKAKSDEHKYTLNVSIEELEIRAQKICASLGLPASRKVNILKDMTNSRFFYQNIISNNCQLLQDLKHTESIETYYIEPPKQIIKCLDCNFETSVSDDISKIILEINSHICK